MTAPRHERSVVITGAGSGVTGLKPGQSFEDHTVEDVERLTAINFCGVFLGCKHGVRQLKAQGGGCLAR